MKLKDNKKVITNKKNEFQQSILTKKIAENLKEESIDNFRTKTTNKNNIIEKTKPTESKNEPQPFDKIEIVVEPIEISIAESNNESKISNNIIERNNMLKNLKKMKNKKQSFDKIEAFIEPNELSNSKLNENYKIKHTKKITKKNKMIIYRDNDVNDDKKYLKKIEQIETKQYKNGQIKTKTAIIRSRKDNVLFKINHELLAELDHSNIMRGFNNIVKFLATFFQSNNINIYLNINIRCAV